MFFSRYASAAAGLVGMASAGLIPDLTAGLDVSPAAFDLGASWDNSVLFNGIVGAETDTDAAVHFGLTLVEAQVEGLVDVATLDNFLQEPGLRLGLEGIKAYFEIDLSASAATYQTIQLVASPELSIDTGLLEVDFGAAFALDLIVGVGAAVDVTAGFYVSFGAGDFIDISVITKEVLGSSLDGLVAHALPIGVGAQVDLSAQVEIQLGLRLRTHVVLEADVDILGLDILGIGAEVAIWVDLVDYTVTLVEIGECPLHVENEFAFSLGVAVNLDLEVLDLLDLSLAPEITVKLAKTLKTEVCLPGRDDDDSTSSLIGATSTVATGSSSAGATSTVSTGVPTITLSSASSTSTGLGSNSTATRSHSLGSSVSTASDSQVTSTTSSTVTYTITSCHASVPNCPATQTQVIVTSTVVSSVYVCPSEGAPAPTTSSSASPTKPVHTITETATTIVPCEPTTSTYTPPASPTPIPPTVTISQSVTVCPETSAPATTVLVPSASVPAVTTLPPVITHPGPGPAPNSTWSSVTVPPTGVIPTGGVTLPPPVGTNPTSPPSPPTAGAGSVKVGVIALAMPAIAVMFL